ncbi:MAG: hypothetical protein V4489_01785 [Chlamydiota bacterium]
MYFSARLCSFLGMMLVMGVVGNSSFAQVIQTALGFSNNFMKNMSAGIEYVLIQQTSNQNAMRSGLFYRAHDNLQVVRLDPTAGF